MHSQINLNRKPNRKGTLIVPLVMCLVLAALTSWIGFSICNKIPDLMKIKTALENKEMEIERKIVERQTYCEMEKNKLKGEKKQSENEQELIRDNKGRLITNIEIREREKNDAKKILDEKTEKSMQHEDDVKKQGKELFDKTGLNIKISEGPPRQYVLEDVPISVLFFTPSELPWYTMIGIGPPFGASLQLAYNAKIYAKRKAAWHVAKRFVMLPMNLKNPRQWI